MLVAPKNYRNYLYILHFPINKLYGMILINRIKLTKGMLAFWRVMDIETVLHSGASFFNFLFTAFFKEFK